MLKWVFVLCCLPQVVFASSLEWKSMGEAVFIQAKQERKIVLLNLEANWCHWCHVMHDSTYSNPEVIAYIEEHFIPVKADQDAHPELSNRYKEYGWPATIFINAEGVDVVKRAGYISPDSFLKLLRAIVADPSPETEERSLALLKPSAAATNVEKTLEESFLSSLDYERGGFDQSQKFVEYATFEYALHGTNDERVWQWIERSIEGARQLSDPEWGGVFQYSTHNDWKHLHYEKLLSIQARYTQLFLWHYLFSGDSVSLDYAKRTVNYADRFLLQPSGLYANAQDADLVQGEHAGDYFALKDQERLELGIPAVDTNTFTDKNAAMGVALLRLYLATGESVYYDRAKTIRTLLLKRKQVNGCYSHTFEPRGVSSLRDQIPLTELFVLFLKIDPLDATASKELRALCMSIRQQFSLENGALKSFSGKLGIAAEPLVEENATMARIFNWYANFSGDELYRQLARKMADFLTSVEVAETYYNAPTVLMLCRELKNEPYEYLYLETSSGSGFSNRLLAMLPFYSMLKRGTIDVFSEDKRVLLETFRRDVLLACTYNYCSSPMYSLADVRKFLR